MSPADTTTTRLTVRPATEKDAAALSAIKHAAAHRAYTFHAGRAAVTAWLDKRGSVEFIRDRITAPKTLFLVAEHHTGTATTLLGGGLIRREPGHSYLSDVYADPPGLGAGTALVRELLDHAARSHWGPTRCFVIAANLPARAFFTGLGFGIVDVVPNPELPGNLVEMRRPG